MPGATSVKVVPLTVHTDAVFEPNCTGKPELAVAESAGGDAPMVWLAGALKLMVWVACATITLRLTGVAPL